MSKLSANGTELLRLEYCSSSVSYRSNGKILRNCGDGWKAFRSCKPGVDPVAHAEKIKERRDARDAACPNFAAFRNRLARYGVSTRNMILTSLDLMPNDPDGVWSTLDDYGKHADLEDLCELSRLYEAAHAECRAYNERTQTAKV